MKIAIMTLPLGLNYGGLMQAWAMQQVLKRLGHDPVTINRQPDPRPHAYRLTQLSYRAAKKIIGKRKAPINLEKYLPSITIKTKAFIDQHIKLSEPLNTTHKLKKHFNHGQYEGVIVGSDQTWRPDYSPNIENYFLDFLADKNILRLAYASSFGVDRWTFTNKQTEQCASLAKKFVSIGVREQSGINLCKKFLGVPATLTLDPTLLLEKNDFSNLIGQHRLKQEEHGIFTYFLDKTDNKATLAKQISKKLNEPIYSSQARYSLSQDHSHLDDYVIPDVEDWLAGFANSKFIVTDSFHGMVFAIIFEKDFIVVLNEERGTERFLSLLKQLGLEQHAIDSSQQHNLISNLKNIDYYAVSTKLNALKKQSIGYLSSRLPHSAILQYSSRT